MDQRAYIKCSPSHRLGVRVFMLNGSNMGKDDLLFLDESLQDHKEKKEEVECWRKKYLLITKASAESLEKIITRETLPLIAERSNKRFKPDDKLPPNIASTHPVLYANAQTKAIEALNEYEDTFVCLTPIVGNFEDIQQNEP
jgi:hypothetical protein